MTREEEEEEEKEEQERHEPLQSMDELDLDSTSRPLSSQWSNAPSREGTHCSWDHFCRVEEERERETDRHRDRETETVTEGDRERQRY